MTQIEKIKKIVAEQKPLLMKRYKVKEIGIFGSYVKGRETKRSDVDLLIEFQKSPGFIGFMEIENFLTDTLGIKVDLVMKSALKPRIGKHILNEVEYL